jgi:hypothetical protein
MSSPLLDRVDMLHHAVKRYCTQRLSHRSTGRRLRDVGVVTRYGMSRALDMSLSELFVAAEGRNGQSNG